jgi:hypothetical protein
MRWCIDTMGHVQTQGKYRWARRSPGIIRIRRREYDESNRSRIWREVRCRDGHGTCPHPVANMRNGNLDLKDMLDSTGGSMHIERERVPAERFGLRDSD